MRCSAPFLRFYNFIENRFNHDFYEEKRFLLKKTIPVFASLGKEKELEELKELNPEIYQSAILEILQKFREGEALISQMESTIQDNTNIQACNDQIQESNTYLRAKLKHYRKLSQLLGISLILIVIVLLYLILS